MKSWSKIMGYSPIIVFCQLKNLLRPLLWVQKLGSDQMHLIGSNLTFQLVILLKFCHSLRSSFWQRCWQILYTRARAYTNVIHGLNYCQHWPKRKLSAPSILTWKDFFLISFRSPNFSTRETFGAPIHTLVQARLLKSNRGISGMLTNRKINWNKWS